MQQAVERARTGHGPTLIEAITYRIGAHTTADDPTRYRISSEIEDWQRKDPIARLQRFLVKQNLLSEEQNQHLVSEVEAEINSAVTETEALPAPAPDGFFDYMSETLSPRLQAQREDLIRHLKGDDRL
jgi:pyruvate dehydrogenase E1 component alpha subunit